MPSQEPIHLFVYGTLTDPERVIGDIDVERLTTILAALEDRLQVVPVDQVLLLQVRQARRGLVGEVVEPISKGEGVLVVLENGVGRVENLC